MRPIGQCRKAASLIAGQPGMHALPAHAIGLGHLADAVAVPEHTQDCVITLFHFAELHEHSATSLRS